MVVVEIFLQGPEIEVMQSAAEFDADPLPDVDVLPGSELKAFLTVNVPLSILHSHPEQLELNRVENPGSDGIEIEHEVEQTRLVSELAGIGLGEDLVLGEALDEDVSGSSPRDVWVSGVPCSQSSISSRRLASSSSSGTASSKGCSSAWSCVGASGSRSAGSDIGDWSWGVLCIEKRGGGSS